ncbi:MAG: hypothetical protein KBB39_17610 [Phycicoccus sp.]|nr:hypothetical protein [Phycicoccus sp.]
MNITDTMTAAAAAVSRFAQTLRGAGYRAKRSPRARFPLPTVRLAGAR